MIGSASTAVVSVLLVYTEPQRARQFLLWGLGSFSGTTWTDLQILTRRPGRVGSRRAQGPRPQRAADG